MPRPTETPSQQVERTTTAAITAKFVPGKVTWIPRERSNDTFAKRPEPALLRRHLHQSHNAHRARMAMATWPTAWSSWPRKAAPGYLGIERP